MDKAGVLEAARALEPADRWELAETILNELEGDHLSEEMKAFLDSRIADYEQNRDQCLPFEEVAARARPVRTMNLPVVLSPLAQRDFDRAYAWY